MDGQKKVSERERRKEEEEAGQGRGGRRASEQRVGRDGGGLVDGLAAGCWLLAGPLTNCR